MSTLGEIMDVDPLQLTKDDERLTTVINYYRGARAKYNAGDMQAGATKKAIPKAAAGLAQTFVDKLEIEI